MSEEDDNTGEFDTSLNTGVGDIKSDDMFRDKHVFDVSKNEYFNNMKLDRNRMRFSKGSKVSDYMKGTKYRSQFFVRYTDKEGQKFIQKIK